MHTYAFDRKVNHGLRSSERGDYHLSGKQGTAGTHGGYTGRDKMDTSGPGMN